MTDSMKVYTNVIKTLKQFLPKISQYQLIVLAMMVTGIVLGKTVQLSKMSLQIPTDEAKPASIEKRCHRFVKNKNVDTEQIYLPFAQLILAHLGKKITVMMDATQVGNQCMALMVAVIYQGRAIPLVWLVYKGKKGHTTSERHKEALELLKPLLSSDTEVVLLGDGEYDTVEMLQWVQTETNWTFIVRSSSNIIIREKEDEYPMKTLLAGKNSCTAIKNVEFTKARFGPVTAIAWWDDPYKKPIYLISNSTHSKKWICNMYKRRYKIETMFSDKKGRGFNLQKTHIYHPERIHRLLLSTSISYIWMVYLGVDVQNDETKRSTIDRTDRTDKSLFRLGLDWFAYRLTRGLTFEVLFDPPPPISDTQSQVLSVT